MALKLTSKLRPAREDLAPPLRQINRTRVVSKGRTLTYFAGCDYFRLASHPDVLAAVHAGLDQEGLNVAASRKTTGNHPLYATLERAMRRFFASGTATLVSNGYMTNLCVAQALAGRITHAIIDERAHGCLFDAVQLLGCPARTFRHRDSKDLKRIVTRHNSQAKLLILTDGLFAHSGEVAPIDEYLRFLPRTARLLIDDAHAAGVLGRKGRGTPEHFGITDERIIQTITLSKAFGVYGGGILADSSLRALILERSRLFVGNTPLPLPLVQGALQALELVAQDPRFRRRLIFNTSYIKAALREAGQCINDGPGPIVPIHPRNPDAAARLSRALLKAGIHPPLINYLGGKNPAYFRFVISSEHDGSQLDSLKEVLLRSLPR